MENLNIKIVGLGDGGARAISKMIAADIGKAAGVEFMAVGNDENILLNSTARKNIFLNRDLTTIYKNFADALSGAQLIFIVGGIGGHAARAAVPVITSCAKNLGAVTVAFVCKPFVMENFLRKNNAEYTLANLRDKVDTLFVVPAEKFFLFRINQPEISLDELFDAANDVFCQGVKIFLDMLPQSDSDLAIFRWGTAEFGYGEGKTPLEAIKAAAKFPTIELDAIQNAAGIFVRLISSKMMKLSSVEAANNFIKEQLPPDAEFFLHEDKDPALDEKIFASIILTRKTAEDTTNNAAEVGIRLLFTKEENF